MAQRALATRIADPLDILAADYGVDRDDLVLLSAVAGRGGFMSLPQDRKEAIGAAQMRVWRILGPDTALGLYEKLKRFNAEADAA